MSRSVFAGLACGLALCSTARASIIPPMSLEQLQAESSWMIHGTVIDQFSQWEEYDGNKIIFTYSTVQVARSRALVPLGSDQVVLRSVGGTVGDYTQVLLGEVQLELGEEIVAFLTLEEGWAFPSVVGLHQGKLRVQRDATGRVEGFVPDRGQMLDASRAAADTMIPVDVFTASLRGVASGLAWGASAQEDQVHPLVRIR